MLILSWRSKRAHWMKASNAVHARLYASERRILDRSPPVRGEASAAFLALLTHADAVDAVGIHPRTRRASRTDTLEML